MNDAKRIKELERQVVELQGQNRLMSARLSEQENGYEELEVLVLDLIRLTARFRPI